MAVNRLLALLFLFVAILPAVVIALAVPPGETPDEPTHTARAGSLLHGQVVGVRQMGVDGAGQPLMNSGVITNFGTVAVSFGFQPGEPKKMTQEILDRLRAIPWSDRPVFVQSPNTASYSPVFYIPASAGLGLGHVLGRSPFTSLLLARIFGLIAFAFIGTLALLAVRRGHVLVFATLVLPMTLWLGGTLNQDGVMMAVLCLSAALLTRVSRPEGWAYWTAGVLLMLVIAVKPPYFLFAAAMLLPWEIRRRAQLLPAMAGVAIALVPAVVWTVIAQSLASGNFVFGPPYHPGPLWPGDPTVLFPAPDAHAQLQVFLHRPVLLVSLVLDRLRDEGWWKINEMIGVLGPLGIVLEPIVYTAWLYALYCAGVSGLVGSGSDSRPSWTGAAAVGLALVGTVFVIYDAQYLSWTTVGKGAIDGVQGRYFLPFLPMLAIALPALRVPGGVWVRGVLALPTLALAVAGLGGIPLLVIQTYYLQ